MFKTTILGHSTPSLLTCVKAVPIAQKTEFLLLTHLHPHTYAHHTISVPTWILKSSLKSQLQCTFFRNTLLHPNYIRAITLIDPPTFAESHTCSAKLPCSIRVLPLGCKLNDRQCSLFSTPSLNSARCLIQTLHKYLLDTEQMYRPWNWKFTVSSRTHVF